MNILLNMKVKDGIIGFVVGDALGVPLEFKSREELEENLINTLREDLDEDYTMNFWVGRNLEEETWVKKV